ncbi:DUF1232 domain-containing protein [Allobranchiibius sp. GilTou38]|nr:DUF1232 domain-containing protein [Allobranchiibius sp. GilTou38]
MSPRQSRRMSASTVRSLRDSIASVADPSGPSVAARLTALPRMVRAVAAKEYTGSSPARVAAMVAAAAYIASPVDLIPEKLAPIVGLADDAVVLAWLANALVHDTDDFLAWEAARKHTVRGRRLR